MLQRLSFQSVSIFKPPWKLVFFLISNFFLDQAISKMCSKKMKVSEEMINKMIQENDHNKYTTLYYLLLRKLEKGELNIEEIKNEQKMEENLEKRKSVQYQPEHAVS